MAVRVPDYVSEAAKRGLAWHAEGKSGDGVTDQTLREARDMASGSVSEDKVRRMGPWFQRHQGDMTAPKNKPDNKDFPGAGAVAWALWGGPTSGDIMRTAKWAEAKAAQLDAEASAKAMAAAPISTPNQSTNMPRIFTDIDDTILKDGQPVEKVIAYIDESAEEVVVLTNRPESEREKTVADLEAIGFEYDALIMNDSGEEAPAFKASVIKAELDAGRPVDLFIDNRKDTRDAVAALGVEVMDPADVPDVVEEDAAEEMPVEAPVAPEAKVAKSGKFNMTIEEQLVQAAASMAGLTAERDDLRSTVEKLTVGAASELEALKVEAAAKDASIASLTEVVKTVEAEAAALKAKVAELEANKASASKEAAKIVASFGTEPVELPKGDSPAKMSNADIKAAYLALPAGQARIAFFNAHKAALISL